MDLLVRKPQANPTTSVFHLLPNLNLEIPYTTSARKSPYHGSAHESLDRIILASKEARREHEQGKGKEEWRDV